MVIEENVIYLESNKELEKAIRILKKINKEFIDECIRRKNFEKKSDKRRRKEKKQIYEIKRRERLKNW